MGIIRHSNKGQQKLGKKKTASQQPKLNLNPGPKSTLVSGIVDQLIKSGYSGNLMSEAGMTYAHPDTQEVGMLEDTRNEELSQDVIVEDIDFNKEEKATEQEELSPTEKRRRQAQIVEDRTRNSQEQIKMVSKSAKDLYKHVDDFISDLRKAAENSSDNPRLGYKLENLRRMCVGFVRSLDSQMPGYPTSLFVNVEETDNETR